MDPLIGDASHNWHMYPAFGWEACRDCGNVRRRDRQNKTCKGVVRVTLRQASQPSNPKEERG